MRLIDLAAPLAPPLCVACGGWAGRAETLCGGCRRALRWLAAEPDDAAGVAVWAPLAYAGPARDVVAALKFRGATRPATAMAAAICANVPRRWLGPAAALVPVPLHDARGRARGFNQAERLAAAIARRTGLTVHDCLRRTGPPATQMGRGRAERLAAMEGTIALRPGAAAPTGPAVLIDDVMTTGATLAACAATLRVAGTTDLKAIAYARTPGR